jgi:hypothetical protein
MIKFRSWKSFSVSTKTSLPWTAKTRTDQQSVSLHRIRETPDRFVNPQEAAPSKTGRGKRDARRHATRGVIEKSDSPWSSPIVMVRKKNGEFRFCVKYGKMNDVTKKDCFPLPRIDGTLDTPAGAKGFPTLDVKSGFGQVDLHPDEKEKTAFSTGQGL